MILIQSDHWRLWCHPNNGAEWLAAEVQHLGHWYAVVPDCREPSSDAANEGGSMTGQRASSGLSAASFHMLPYSNRIRDGRFSFNGCEYQLREADRHAIHGALRKLPWQIVEQSPAAVTCRIDSQNHPGINWPWAIEAMVTHRVEDKNLISSLSLTNRDKTPMPAGLGWHPYFVRQIEGAGAEPTLTLPVDAVFPDASGDCLPDGAAVALPDALDFRQGRRLDPSQFIDCCLAGLNGCCHIEWTDTGIALAISASESCRYLVLYNPEAPYFAVEPVTNANDAFNLAARNIESGMQVLAPGESLQAKMTLTLCTSQV